MIMHACRRARAHTNVHAHATQRVCASWYDKRRAPLCANFVRQCLWSCFFFHFHFHVARAIPFHFTWHHTHTHTQTTYTHIYIGKAHARINMWKIYAVFVRPYKRTHTLHRTHWDDAHRADGYMYTSIQMCMHVSGGGSPEISASTRFERTIFHE